MNTASEAGLSGAVGQPNYSAAKAGVIQLTLNVPQALAKHGWLRTRSARGLAHA